MWLLKYTIFSLLLFTNSTLFAKSDIINLDELFKQNSASHKHIMVFFHMNHCPYCERMDKSTLQDTKIQNILQKKFIFIDINTDEKKSVLFHNKLFTQKEFAHSLDIDFYPTVVFFDTEKEIIYTAKGLRKIDKFKKILRFIHTKSYEEGDFFDFK